MQHDKLIAQRGRREIRSSSSKKRVREGGEGGEVGEGEQEVEEKPTNLMNSPGILDKCSLTRPKHLAACSMGSAKGQGKGRGWGGAC